jgi:FKBP-type peptidyl-prolyl cis-trans isomerase
MIGSSLNTHIRKGTEMTSRWILMPILALFAAVAVAQDAPALKTQKDKLSYALGLDLGNQFKRQSIEIDAALLAQGLKDALSGGKALLSETEVRAAINELQSEMKRKQLEAIKQLGEKNKTEGESFLAANKAKEGVITLPSGLQYKILKAGEGKKPSVDDTVECHYRGTLIDGTEFDSSYKRNQPATFAVKGVIKGWTEALQLMTVGSKWQLFIPSSLAYGERGTGPNIGPNATLIFEVELISIKDRP